MDKWGRVGLGGGIFWVDGGGWTYVMGGWRWAGVGRGIFWVGGGVWTHLWMGGGGRG